ncbi:DUF4387 family protein [Hydrogenophaga sp. BPS33]|uniref:DUF4387 family protein n=1 Tax=Hydrogenophaga sp. BPS33 TaxID=2651974 RepID=UPI00131F845E|nr:DUF4387 family protein [Hydrogenophaga sp. BPS33]QHE85259.1 DUF4387 domain-containing protein [Hydrogenophaga sp. BPS33]
MSPSNTTPSPTYAVRTKNAGPFWLTIDIFCDDKPTFWRLREDPRLCAQAIGDLLRTDANSVKIFHIDALDVIKISLPRPVVQGAVADRDMHGAQWAYLLQEQLEKPQ